MAYSLPHPQLQLDRLILMYDMGSVSLSQFYLLGLSSPLSLCFLLLNVDGKTFIRIVDEKENKKEGRKI